MKQFYKLVLFFLVFAAPVAGVAQSKGETPQEPNVSDQYYASACSSYVWHDVEYTQSGDYIYIDAVNNDTVTLHLTILNSFSVEEIIACDSTEWHGRMFFESTDTATYITTNAVNCDSLVTLHLTINHSTGSDTSAIACEEFTWRGTTYTESGNYPLTLTNAANCDSVVTLHLTIHNPAHQAFTVTECETYTWTDGNGQTYTASGDYTYSHQDNNGCTQVDTLHLTINNPEHSSMTHTACGDYTWSEGNGQTYTESGDYTYSHADTHGCTQVDTLHLTVNPLPEVTITSTSATDTVCGGGVVLMANGDPDYEYHWNTGATSSWISVDTSNTYSVTVTDPTTHCSNSASKEIIVNQPYNLTIDSTICQGEFVNFFGETKDSTGVYTRTTTAANGCDSTVTLVLTVKPLPVFVITGDLEICEGDTTTLTVHGEDTYQWSTGSMETSISVSQFGTYMVTATKDNCTASDSVTVNVYPLPTVSISGDNSFCQGASTTLVASGASTYTWSNGASGDSTTVSYPGFYTVTGTNTNGCSSIDTITVRFITIIYSSDSVTVCQGDSVEFHGQIYKTTGVYIYTNDCDTVETLTLVVNPLPNVTISGESSFCEGDGTMLIAMGANTYAWKNGSNNDTSYVTTADTITVTGTDTNNCSNTASLIVTMNPTYYNNTIIRDTICEGESYIFYGDTLTTSCSRPHTLQTVNGCDSVVTLYLTVNPQPEVSINGPSSFCQGDSIPLVVEGASSYVWNNNVTARFWYRSNTCYDNTWDFIYSRFRYKDIY